MAWPESPRGGDDSPATTAVVADKALGDLLQDHCRRVQHCLDTGFERHGKIVDRLVQQQMKLEEQIKSLSVAPENSGRKSWSVFGDGAEVSGASKAPGDGGGSGSEDGGGGALRMSEHKSGRISICVGDEDEEEEVNGAGSEDAGRSSIHSTYSRFQRKSMMHSCLFYDEKGDEEGGEGTGSRPRLTSFGLRSKETGTLHGSELDDIDTTFKGRINKVVDSLGFDIVVALMILLNSALVGLETEYHTRTPDRHTGFFVANCLFNLWFVVELALRIIANGRQFLESSAEWRWNVFDVFLVTATLVDIMLEVLMAGGSVLTGGVIRIVRILRVLRTFRILRSMRHVREFSRMIFALQASSMTLLWSMVLLVLFIYAFAVLLTQGTSDWLHETKRLLPSPDDPEEVQALRENYSTLARSFYSLYMAMSSGMNWGIVVEPLGQLHWTFELLFLVFISTSIFGVLNVVTSVFVESAMTSAEHYRDLIVQECLHTKEVAIQHLKRVFMTIDSDGSGAIAQDEMEHFLSDPELCMYLEALDIVANDARVLFKLLDRDRSGVIDIDEFCDGCMRLKGEAKSFDIHCMIYESTRLMARLADFMAYVEERLGDIDKEINQARSARGRPSVKVMRSRPSEASGGVSGLVEEKQTAYV